MRKDEDMTHFAIQIKVASGLVAEGYVPSENSQACALLRWLPEEYSSRGDSGAKNRDSRI